MLCIRHPPGYRAERAYIYDVLIGEFLGLPYRLEAYAGADVQITLTGDPHGHVLSIADCLFQTPREHWLTPASLPRRPLRRWDGSGPLRDVGEQSQQLPIVYGRDDGELTFEAGAQTGIAAAWKLDLFGSAFWMLTRYEEAVSCERDGHARFPAGASLAFREHFLARPIVNEYLEMLWRILERLWPGLQRKQRGHRVLLSHDVDLPLCTAGKPPLQVLKSGLGDIVQRHDPALACRRLQAYFQARRGCFDNDPCNTFDFVMDLSERYGRQSAFYFIAGHSAGAIDGSYSLDDPWIGRLIRHIDQRGHEVGLHPSYNTYRDAVQTRRELQRLVQAVAATGVDRQVWGGRQHYLRWENPGTWQNWEDAGLAYDSSLSFADHVGFRCGTCYEYPVFNLTTRQRLGLRERPLIVMDVALVQYMRRTWEAAVSELLHLNSVCKQFRGDFTLLWHNNHLISRAQRYWYSVACEQL